MHSSELPDDSSENPFEFSGESNVDGAGYGSDPQHIQEEVPPVKSSYWIGAAAIWLVSFMPCLVSVTGFDPIGIGVLFDILSGFFIVIAWFSTLMFFAVPLCLIRLWIHRHNIANAIERQSYPGKDEFDFMYLLYSLVLCSLCLMGGGVLFFGICTGLFIITEPLKNPIVEYIGLPLLAFDGIISLVATVFLIRIGVPKYR